ncbi:MAG: hypothetical protein ACI4PH_02480 [Faecousia sp.]
MFEDLIFYFVAAVLGSLLLLFSFLSLKYPSGKAKLVISLVDTCLITLSTLLILLVLLNQCSMGQAFGPAAIAVVFGSLIAAAKQILYYTLRRKRRLTDQQKAKLMDL